MLMLLLPSRPALVVLGVCCVVLFAPLSASSKAAIRTTQVRTGAVTTGAVSLSADPVPLTECAACRDYGSCAQAFRGSPGQFCHTVSHSGLACCCPEGSACITNRPSQCLCQAISTKNRTLADTITDAIFGLSYAVVLLLACRSRRQRRPRCAQCGCLTVVYDPEAREGDAATHCESTPLNGRDSQPIAAERRPRCAQCGSLTFVYDPVVEQRDSHSYYGSTLFSGDSGGTFGGDAGDSGDTFCGDS